MYPERAANSQLLIDPNVKKVTVIKRAVSDRVAILCCEQHQDCPKLTLPNIGCSDLSGL